jgi:hypothetical protein
VRVSADAVMKDDRLRILDPVGNDIANVEVKRAGLGLEVWHKVSIKGKSNNHSGEGEDLAIDLALLFG